MQKSKMGRLVKASELTEIAKKDILVEDEKDKIDTELRIIDIILNPSTPDLCLNTDIKDFFDFDNSKELHDSKLVKYKHMGSLTIPKAQ